MWHRKFDRDNNLIEGCGGRVFVDRAVSDDSWIEPVCIKCGRRWLLDVSNNVFAKRLVRIEKRFVNAGNK